LRQKHIPLNICHMVRMHRIWMQSQGKNFSLTISQAKTCP
jgi:hypothetical protein